MELVSVTITGWRRFPNKVSLQTNGKMVAVLGPNEAGKSSVLDALRFLDSSDDARPQDVARGKSEKDLRIVGYYHLNVAERAEARLDVPTRLVLTKKHNETGIFHLEPRPPERSTVQRHKARDQLRRALLNSKFKNLLAEDVEVAAEAAVTTLSLTNEDLTDEQINQLNSVGAKLAEIDTGRFPRYIVELAGLIAGTAADEGLPNPTEFAESYLADKIPNILLFGSDDRDLRQEYNIDDIKNDVPTALENLANIAELDIASIVAALDRNDTATVETIRVRANRRLRQRFKETWSQAGVRTSFVIKDRILNVLIENDEDEFTALAERSDGFRQFVALQSFVMRKRSHDPILLIDEAELHLHYDAQADLVQMLSRQKVAGKVIYTTHSAGCLPEDLGNGVRLVSPTKEKPTVSKIINRFWGASEPGFSPLLIGMGASTLAFFPTRRALVVEGETEMLLLPTMIREALGSLVLGFQVVPGLSKANKSLLPSGREIVNHLAYLVDGDAGGRALEGELKRNGVREASIFKLPLFPDKPTQIKDFIADSVLADALRNLCEKFTPGRANDHGAALAETGKIKSIASTYYSITGKILSKVDLAYEVLSIANESPDKMILDDTKRMLFAQLSSEVGAYFTERTA